MRCRNHSVPRRRTGAALLAHDRELAGRLLAGGTGTWALSKLVKQMVRRPRPAALVSGARTRGRDASGLGYLSGHAGVAVALGTAVFPRLGPSGRAEVAAAVPIVGLSRIYVGAHLPLDVAGGAGLGLAVEAAVALVRHPGAAIRVSLTPGVSHRAAECRPGRLPVGRRADPQGPPEGPAASPGRLPGLPCSLAGQRHPPGRAPLHR